MKLPFRGGTITLVRKTSTRRSDGSISWRGEVADTGEPAALMVWNNAPLTGYFAYDGTIFTIENVGGGVNIFAEMGPCKISDHPSLASSCDNAISSQSVTPGVASLSLRLHHLPMRTVKRWKPKQSRLTL